ncbi:YceI family protein [Lishizhenia sp.]|uniref:YceI family protein n=1 Tax=Lishizhenia sp. TaxID=2497594 RepID=UPI00299DCEF3|nr:YceI family protein [Lishizhenia sp.]MDX1445079.1 YceI family protein [Lishizhenia sp.]
MVNITIATFFIFSLLAHILQQRNKLQYYKRLHFTVLGAGLLLVNYSAFESQVEATLPLPSFLLSVLGLSFIFAIIFKRITSIAFAFLPVLASFAFLLLPAYELSYYGNVITENQKLFAFALLGAITPVLTHGVKLLVSSLVVKFGNVIWKEQQENQLETLITYTFIGGLTLMSAQVIGALGLIVAATFYLSTTILSEDKLGINNILAFSASASLFLLTLIPFLLTYGNFEVLDFSRGEVLAGLFVSGLLLMFHRIFLRFATNSQTSWSYLYIAKNYLFPLFITFVLAILYTQKENLGGILSLSALVIGLAILTPIKSYSSNRVSIPVDLGVIAMVLFMLPYIKPVEIEEKSDLELIQKDEKVSVEEQKGESLEIAKGNWDVVSDKSTLKFALGPEKARTEGVFNEIKGTFQVPADITRSKFFIQIPVESLSTFVDLRDDHLMEAEYFDVEKYPTLLFRSNQVVANGDEYTAKGSFKMKGIEREIDVHFKVLGVADAEDKKVLILNVKSSLDRTKFGMDSDPSIGDIVDFDFQVQLEK